MALGLKVKSVKPKRSYTIEQLYDAIKDKPFEAGKPELDSNGFARIITFPAIDSQNQVWVMVNSKGDKISIQKSQATGSLGTNYALDAATGGLFGFGFILGGHVKRCEALVEATAKELEALDL
ncbi:MAG: hypothetical protein WAY93_03330 [Atopobiaceae bacterium]|jgi:hypothetical protein